MLTIVNGPLANSMSCVYVYCSFLFNIVEFHYDYVTCGSVLKLLNVRNNVRLHSHDVKYGSGSGQQVSELIT